MTNSKFSIFSQQLKTPESRQHRQPPPHSLATPSQSMAGSKQPSPLSQNTPAQSVAGSKRRRVGSPNNSVTSVVRDLGLGEFEAVADGPDIGEERGEEAAPAYQNPIVWNDNAEDTAKKSDKGKRFYESLIELGQMGLFFCDKLASAHPPRHYSNKGFLRHCLALVDYLSGDYKEAIEIVRGANTSGVHESNLVNAACKLESACAKQLEKWDTRKTKKGGKTFLAMGKRICQYQSRIKKAKNLPASIKPESVPLISLSDLERIENAAT